MASFCDSKGKLDDGVKRASESPIPWKIQQVLQQFEARLSEKDVQIAELEKKIENLQIGRTSDKNQSTRRPSKNSKKNKLRNPAAKPAHHDGKLTKSTNICSPDSQRSSAATTTIYQRGQGYAKEGVNRIETLARTFAQKFKIVLTAADVKIGEKYDLKSIAEVVAKIWYLTEKYYRGLGTEFERKEVLVHLANFNITQFMMFPFFYNLYYNSIVPKLTEDVKMEPNMLVAQKERTYIRKLSNITEGLINLYLGICLSLVSNKYSGTLPGFYSGRNVIFQQTIMNLILDDSCYNCFNYDDDDYFCYNCSGLNNDDLLKSYLQSCYVPAKEDGEIISWDYFSKNYNIPSLNDLFDI